MEDEKILRKLINDDPNQLARILWALENIQSIMTETVKQSINGDQDSQLITIGSQCKSMISEIEALLSDQWWADHPRS